MKKNHLYEINPLNNTAIISKRLYEQANQLGDEYRLLQKLRDQGFTLMLEQRSPRKTPKSEKEKRRISYKMMQKYIKLLDDSEDMLAAFEKVKQLAKSKPQSYDYVLNWFYHEFPHYNDFPSFDANWNVVHDPNPMPLKLENVIWRSR